MGEREKKKEKGEIKETRKRSCKRITNPCMTCASDIIPESSDVVQLNSFFQKMRTTTKRARAPSDRASARKEQRTIVQPSGSAASVLQHDHISYSREVFRSVL